MHTYRLAIHLESGAKIVTEEVFETDEAEFVKAEVEARIEDRELGPWKELGHALVNFKAIVAVEVEAL